MILSRAWVVLLLGAAVVGGCAVGSGAAPSAGSAGSAGAAAAGSDGDSPPRTVVSDVPSPSAATLPPLPTSLATCPPAPLPCVDPAYHWGLGLSNATSLTVTLVVNGHVVGTYAALQGTLGAELSPSDLPPLPWHVEARSTSGRVLVQMDVRTPPLALVYPDGHGGSVTGSAGRVDLSCGRLDIWAGPPLLGPMPGPGTPGDCAP